MHGSTRHVWDKLWNAFWVLPAACVLAALVLALVLPQIPLPDGGNLIFAGGPAGARSLLSAITSAMISLTALTFSITMLAFVMSSRQFSPRVLRNFQRDRVVQLSLGVFIATFTYAMVVLRSVRGTTTSNGYVPQLAVAVAFTLVLGSVAMFVTYIARITNLLRSAGLVNRIRRETEAALEVSFPAESPGGAPAAPAQPAGPPERRVCAPQPGVLVSVRTGNIVAQVAGSGGVAVVALLVGEFVPRGGTVFELHGDAARLADEDLLGTVSFANERSYEHDVAFGLRELVDIAERGGLAAHDPTTAVQAIDMLHDLLRRIVTRPQPSGRFADSTGELRLVRPITDLDDALSVAVDELAHYADGDLRVPPRLHAMLTDLRSAALPEHQPLIDKRLRALGER